MSRIRALKTAKINKNDEYYTFYEDIEKELQHYTDYFNDKTIYLFCDDYRTSNFWKYYFENFHKFGIKRLIATGYNPDGGIYAEYDGTEIKTGKLNGDGSYCSDECVEILRQSDLMVTNPPFSKIRKIIDFLLENKAKFILLAPLTINTYLKLFSRIQKREVVNGWTFDKATSFITPSGIKKYNITWINNIGICPDIPFLELSEKYSPEKYPHYDNYDAIEVSHSKQIPCDYYGLMGVPVSFLKLWNPNQFEIICAPGINNHTDFCTKKYNKEEMKNYRCELNATSCYYCNGKLKTTFF